MSNRDKVAWELKNKKLASFAGKYVKVYMYNSRIVRYMELCDFYTLCVFTILKTTG